MASANDTSRRLQSNEEVIEELTRDLESSSVRVDDNCSSDKNARSKDTIEGDSWDVMDEERNEDGNAQNTDVPLEDVDEELLKDRDLLLTESEQEVRICDVSETGHLFCNLLFSLHCNLFTFADIEMRGGEPEAGRQRSFQKW